MIITIPSALILIRINHVNRGRSEQRFREISAKAPLYAKEMSQVSYEAIARDIFENRIIHDWWTAFCHLLFIGELVIRGWPDIRATWWELNVWMCPWSGGQRPHPPSNKQSPLWNHSWQFTHYLVPLKLFLEIFSKIRKWILAACYPGYF